MNVTEMLLAQFRNYNKNVTIQFKDYGKLIITCDGIIYDGSALSTEEALLNALVYFQANELTKQRKND